MRRKDRREFYSTRCNWGVLALFLTDGGTHAFKNVEVYVRYGRDDRSGEIGWRRRHMIFESIEEVQQYCIRETPLSLEFCRIFPTQPESSLLSTQEYRDFMHTRQDSFLLRHILAFDWDIDDDLRQRWGGCTCGEKDICALCWTAFAEPARAALDRVLTYWMGFKHLQFTYSGRRGFHVWVLDKGTRELTEEQRRVIIDKVTNIPLKSLLYHDIYPILQHYYDRYHLAMPAIDYGPWEILYTLDIPVTAKVNHAVALPLTPHAKTGNMRLPLTVPFDPIADAVKCNALSYEELAVFGKLFIRK